MHRRANSFATSVLPLLLWMNWFFVGCIGKIIKAPADTEVYLNGSTYLNCSTSNLSETINWYHYLVGKSSTDQKYVYAYGQMYPPYDQRFRIEKNSETGSLNLIISGVEQDDAGLYVCQNGRNTGFTAQLIVIDSTPVCDSNIQQAGLIGPNCCGLQQDSIQLSCRIKYFGNIPPKLKWMQVLKNKTSIQLLDEVTNCRNVQDSILCNIAIETNSYMDGSQLVCQSNRSRNVQYYKSDSIGVKYALSSETQMMQQIDTDITCSANTNSLFCSYTWVWFDGVNDEVVSHNAHTKVKNPGWYRCEASCELKSESCKFNATEVLVMNTDGGETNAPLLYGITIAVVISITLVAFIFVLLRLRNRGSLRRRRKMTAWNGSPPIVVDMGPEKYAELDYKNKDDKDFASALLVERELPVHAAFQQPLHDEPT